MSTRPLFIGVAGGTGSGKTTVARQIRRALAARCAMIDHDSYYRDLSHMPFEERVKTNFDHPSSLENELLASHLAQLASGEPVQKPIYDFSTHTRTAESETIEPAAVILIEGILVLADPNLRKHMDIKVFVDTDADVRVFRRIRRDMDERGRTFDEIRKQYYATVRPMHLEFVAPSRAHADIIIPEGGENRVAIGLVVRALTGMTGGHPALP